MPCCTDDQRAIAKSAGIKMKAVADFRKTISRKLVRVSKIEDNFWEVRLSLRSRSLFFCLNSIVVSIVLEVREGGIFGSASLDGIARESTRNGRRSGRVNVEFHGIGVVCEGETEFLSSDAWTKTKAVADEPEM